MNFTKEIRQNAKEIRKRLRNPPNAVPDSGFKITRISSGIKGNHTPPEPTPEPPGPPRMKLHPAVVLPLTFDRIIRTVADYSGLTPGDLKSVSRRRDISHARWAAVYLGARLLKNRTMASMARELNKDHSSILYAQGQFQKSLLADLALTQTMEQLAERCVNHC